MAEFLSLHKFALVVYMNGGKLGYSLYLGLPWVYDVNRTDDRHGGTLLFYEWAHLAYINRGDLSAGSIYKLYRTWNTGHSEIKLSD